MRINLPEISKYEQLTDTSTLFENELTPEKMQSLQNMEGLTLAFFKNMNVLEFLPKKLKALTLFACSGLQDEHLKELSSDLVYLRIDGCIELTNNALNYLPTTLKILNVSLAKFTKEAVETYRIDHPNIHVIHEPVTVLLR